MYENGGRGGLSREKTGAKNAGGQKKRKRGDYQNRNFISN